MTYSTTADMLVGDVYSDNTIKQKHVDLASKEVDERLGFKYSTPFVQGAVSGPAWNLISRIANFIASGRFLMEMDQSGEEKGVHAYGLSLLTQANEAIKMILDGEVDLVPDAGTPESLQAPHSVLTMNVDPYSQVEAFYGYTARPHVPMDGVYYPGVGGPFMPGAFPYYPR